MNTYNLGALDDKEFEALAVDLIGEEIGMRIERFKPGKDKGVDGRWFTTEKREAIVQCKHWIRSGFRALQLHLTKAELPKIAHLKPDRYILVTSVELSRHNKQALCKQLDPFVLTERDIYGSEDIHDLLAKHPEIEQRHYKLWLTSATAIGYIVNNAINGRSAFNARKVTEKLPLIIKTDDFEKALSLLSRRHAVIITGAPGIGKTTLAEQLLVKLMADGFELVAIEQDINEAESVYASGKKQVFYFDDFLGRNFLEALAPKADSHIVGFMNRISYDKTKRFLLTSRSTILNQAKQLADLFGLEKIEKNEYEVRIEELTRWDRARILYSHIWHSELPHEALDELFKEKRYKAVADHRNFNPRLVSFVTDSDRAALHVESGYWKYVVDTLENPQGIWSNVFTAQLSQQCRDLVYLVAFNGRSIAESSLLNAFRQRSAIVIGDEGKVEHDIMVALRICIGSVLNRKVNAITGHVEYELFNPSIADYVFGSIREWRAYRRYFSSLRSRSAIRMLAYLWKAKVVSDAAYVDILNELAKVEIECGSAEYDSYAVDLSQILIDHEETRMKYSEFIHGVVNTVEFSSCGDCYRNVMYLTSEGLNREMIDAPIARVAELVDSLGSWPFIYDDAPMLAIIISQLPIIERDEVEHAARKHVKGLWSEYVSEYVSDNDLLDDIYSKEQYVEASKTLSSAVSEALTDTGFAFAPAEVEEICTKIDLDGIVKRNIERAEYRSDEPAAPTPRKADTEDQMIEDLFERSDR